MKLKGNKMNTRYNKVLQKIIEQHVFKIYYTQKSSNKKRHHGKIPYSKTELLNWVKKQPNYRSVYNNWIDNDFNKNLSPSCDRLDVSKGYSFDNMQLVTWGENLANEVTRKSIEVGSYDLDGTFIKKFSSISSAAMFYKADIGTYARIVRDEKTYDEKNEVFLVNLDSETNVIIRKKIRDVKGLLKTASDMKILKYDLNGVYVDEYPNITMAAKSNKISRSRILESIKTRSTTSGGFIWIRNYIQDKNKIVLEVLNNIKTRDPRRKPIVKCDLGGFIVKKYNSLSEVTTDGYSKGTISQALNGVRNLAYNSVWLYADDASVKNIQRKINIINSEKIEQYDLNGQFIKVFDSVKDASIAMKTSSSNIYAVLTGRRKSTCGYFWKRKCVNKKFKSDL